MTAGGGPRLAGLGGALAEQKGVAVLAGAAPRSRELEFRAGFYRALQAGLLREEPDLVLREGLSVALHDLDCASGLNGAEGICQGWDAGRGRWQVRLRSGEVKLVRPQNLEAAPRELRPDFGLPTAAFDVGDVCETTAVLAATEEEEEEKAGAAEGSCRLPARAEVQVVAVGTGPTGRRLRVRGDAGAEGWVSVVDEAGGSLLRVTWPRLDPAWKSEAFAEAFAADRRRRRVEAEEARAQAWGRAQPSGQKATSLDEWGRGRMEELQRAERAREAAARPDSGAPTAAFCVGDVCEVVNGSLMRAREALDSPQLRKLPHKCRVEVVQIGTGPTGKRLCVRDEPNREGWISVVANNGESLLRLLHRKDPAKAAEEAAQLAQVELEAKAGIWVVVGPEEVHGAMLALQEKLEDAGIPAFNPTYFSISDKRGRQWKNGDPAMEPTEGMFPLIFRYSPPREVRIGGLPAQGARDVRPTAGIPTPVLARTYARMFEAATLGLPDGPGPAAPEALPVPAAVAEGALARYARVAPAQCALPWEVDAVAPSACQLARLGELDLGLRAALGRGDLPGAQALACEAEAMRMLPGLLREALIRDWRGPPGTMPFEHRGRILTLRVQDNLLFDPSAQTTWEGLRPVGVWNPRRGRAEPAAAAVEGEDFTQVTYFGKTWLQMPRGELIDPDTEMVVGAFSMETLQIEPIEPVPVRVAELLEGRGYRLRADRPAVASRFGSARRPRELSDGPAALPFVEILRPSQRGSPDRSEVLEAVECGNWLALQRAPSELRGDKELVLQALRASDDPRSLQLLRRAPVELCLDREVALAAVRQDPGALAVLPDGLRADRDLVLEAVRFHPLALALAGEGPRADREVVLEAVRGSWRALEEASGELRADREVVLEAVRQSWMALEHASEGLLEDREILLEAVRQDWRALRRAAPAVHGDEGVLLAALAAGPGALSLAPEALRADRAFVRQALQVCPRALAHASEELRADGALAAEAVGADWRALGCVAEALRADVGLVLAAVAQSWEALALAMGEACNDAEVVLEAYKQNRAVLPTVSRRLVSDRSFMLRAVRVDGLALRHADEVLRSDAELVLEAAAQAPESLRLADRGLFADRGFALRAAGLGAEAFALVTEELRGDRGVALEAVARDWGALRHAGAGLRSDRAFVLEAVRVQGRALGFASDELRADREVVLAAVRQCGLALECAGGALRHDAEVALEAVRQDWEAVELVDEGLRGDRGFVGWAVEVNGLCLRGASRELRADPELALAALRRDWRAVRHAAQELRASRAFMLEAVRINGLTLAYAAAGLRADPLLLRASMGGLAGPGGSRPSPHDGGAVMGSPAKGRPLIVADPAAAPAAVAGAGHVPPGAAAAGRAEGAPKRRPRLNARVPF